MRCFVYGIKAHVVCEKEGAPVAFFLTPASTHDLTALKSFSLKLPPHSSLYADKAYNDYHLEKLLNEQLNISLMPIRKQNSKKKYTITTQKHINSVRKQIESPFSQIKALFPKSIHAVTQKGFILKSISFLFACSFQKI